MISGKFVKPTQLCHCQEYMKNGRMWGEKALPSSATLFLPSLTPQSIKMSHEHNTNVVSQGNMQMAACPRNSNPIKNAEDVNSTIFHSS